MTLHLTHHDAQVKMNQVDEAMGNAITLGNHILDNTQTMTSSSWQGDRAAKFSAIMTQHHTDFNTVIRRLQQVVADGKAHMTTLVNAETQ
jgi:uncharacterized protein YukE